MARFHNINGERIQYTQAEENARDKEEADWLKEKTATQYKTDRQLAYPPWEEQLEKIFDDGLTKWKTEMIQPVKDKYPKP